MIHIDVLALLRVVAQIEVAGFPQLPYAFLDRSPRHVPRIVHPVLAFLDFDFGRAAHADDCNTTGELGQPLLQLLAVVVGGGRLDLCFDLAAARLDFILFPAPPTIVVSSFVIVTRRARPSMSIVTFSSLMPSSSLTSCPPVTIAMSSSIGSL